ncbi:winged helix-turn-helix transcriptional regulator [Ancylobacter sp. A5.8]|uniref:winged helix-turn-helix transcriptional regulator n=1 Tax=Ancylobacter gelatini TaxID=2919920 RepID=UPI001F4E9B4E|nr:winged helix-turn-helix transcriptional regulator [Ancylobacter gelatini]MCJ8143973.1 winged helix-turn-helix transcriptional regulator [Ancylobacter gelatini]
MQLKKITKKAEGSARRYYEDACAAAHALDLFGERWALLVMRELMLGPKRFTDLKADLPGISANVLTQRLESLEAAGVLVRRKLPPPASAQVYELTPWGYESEPIFQAMGRWAARSPSHDPTLPFGSVSLMMSMRTMISPALAGALAVDAEFRTGKETFRVRLAGGELTTERGTVEHPDFVLTGEARMIAAAIYGGQPIAALEAAGVLKLEGDRALAERFIRLFPLPPKAVLPG